MPLKLPEIRGKMNPRKIPKAIAKSGNRQKSGIKYLHCQEVTPPWISS